MEKATILNAYDNEIQKEFEFEEYIKNLTDEYSLMIFKLNGQRRREYAGSLFSVDVRNDNIYDIVKEKYGGGEYFIQIKTGNKLGSGTTILIQQPQAVQAIQPQNTEIEILKKQIETLAGLMQSQKSEDSEMKILEKMKTYKELFSSGSGDVSQIMKMFKEGMELGKSITNPEPPEENNTMLSGFIQAALPIMMGSANNNRPAMIQQPVQKQEVKSEIKQPQEVDEMQTKYISLILKIKYATNLQGENQEQKITTLANDIIDFYDEILPHLKNIKTIDEVKKILSGFGYSATDKESECVIKIITEINAILNCEVAQ